MPNKNDYVTINNSVTNIDHKVIKKQFNVDHIEYVITDSYSKKTRIITLNEIDVECSDYFLNYGSENDLQFKKLIAKRDQIQKENTKKIIQQQKDNIKLQKKIEKENKKQPRITKIKQINRISYKTRLKNYEEKCFKDLDLILISQINKLSNDPHLSDLQIAIMLNTSRYNVYIVRKFYR